MRCPYCKRRHRTHHRFRKCRRRWRTIWLEFASDLSQPENHRLARLWIMIRDRDNWFISPHDQGTP